MNQRYASRPLRHAAELRRKCPACKAELPVTDRRCGVCRTDLRAHLARRVSDADAVEIPAGWWRRFVSAVLGEVAAER